jgi:predicted phage tail component-like protein
MTTDVTWNGTDLSTVADFAVLNVIRPMMPTPRDVRVDVPGRPGTWLYVEKPGDRTIVLEVAYVGDDFADRRDQLAAFARWLHLDGPGRLIVDDASDRYWRGRLSAAPTPSEVLNLARFTVEFVVEPYALSTTVSEVTDTQSAAGVFGPDTFTGGGDVPTPPSIEVSAGSSGMAGGFVLDVNGVELVYSADLSADETVTVSSVSSLVLSSVGVDVDLTGAFDPDYVDMRDVSGDFGLIVPGDNNITLTPDGSENGASLTVNYRRRFLA